MKKPPAFSGELKTHTMKTPSISPLNETPSPEDASFSRSRPSKDRPRRADGTQHQLEIRQLFRRLRHRTTRSERTSPHCLARNIARPPSRLLLKPHSHSTAFQSPGFPRQAPGTLPAAAELPALAMFFELRVTLLSGVTRRDRHRMRSSPEPYIVCTMMLMVISGDRT